MPRTYNQHKTLPPLRVVSTPQIPVSTELKPWKDGIRLHSLQQASEILTAELGCNYSVPQIRRRIKQGLLGQAGAIWIYDGSYKINIPAFLEWRIANPDEKVLRQNLRINRA